MYILEYVLNLIEEVGAGAAVRNLGIGRVATRAARGEIKTQLSMHRKAMNDIRQKHGALVKGQAPSPERVAAVATEKRRTAEGLDRSVHDSKNVKAVQTGGERSSYDKTREQTKENFIHLGSLNKKTMDSNKPKYVSGNDWGVSGEKVKAKGHDAQFVTPKQTK